MATKKESKSSFERDYTIPLRKGIKNIVTYKKAARTVREVQEFLLKHTKAKTVRLGMHLNEFLWKHGMRNPPPRVKVHVVVKDDVATAELFGKELKQAVKSEKKKDPQNLKEKLEAKLGVENTKSDEEKTAEKSSEAPKEKSDDSAKEKPKKKSAAKSQ